MGRTSGGAQPTTPATAANVLVGFQTFAASGGPTAVVTVPAGRTWVGVAAVTVSCAEAAAGAVQAQATGVVSTAGAGVTPAAGNYVRCTALAGANAATGLVGDGGNNAVTVPLVVVAPAANAVTVQATATIAGTAGEVNVTASGTLQ